VFLRFINSWIGATRTSADSERVKDWHVVFYGIPGPKKATARGKDLLYPPSMAPPTTPIASSSNIKSKRLKKPSEKSRKENAASLNAEAANAVVGISNRNEASSTLPVAADSNVPADYYGDVEFGEFDYDAVNANEHAELWLIRAPTAVRLFFFSFWRVSLQH
jgi:hypothetical protein